MHFSVDRLAVRRRNGGSPRGCFVSHSPCLKFQSFYLLHSRVQETGRSCAVCVITGADGREWLPCSFLYGRRLSEASGMGGDTRAFTTNWRTKEERTETTNIRSRLRNGSLGFSAALSPYPDVWASALLKRARTWHVFVLLTFTQDSLSTTNLSNLPVQSQTILQGTSCLILLHYIQSTSLFLDGLVLLKKPWKVSQQRTLKFRPTFWNCYLPRHLTLSQQMGLHLPLLIRPFSSATLLNLISKPSKFATLCASTRP